MARAKGGRRAVGGLGLDAVSAQRCWPLPDRPQLLPPAQGRFGAIRRHDIHTGIDLYCPEGSQVAAIEDGQVIAVLPFTGPDAESPWWHPTDAVMVEDDDGVWLYGEIAPSVSVGQHLCAGQILGHVVRVLKHDKGLPTTMLHLERYARGTRGPVWWRHGEPMPETLRDPSERLPPVEGPRSSDEEQL